MGEDGYLKIAEKLMTVATKMKDGINAIEVLSSLLISNYLFLLVIISLMFAGSAGLWHTAHDYSSIHFLRC